MVMIKFLLAALTVTLLFIDQGLAYHGGTVFEQPISEKSINHIFPYHAPQKTIFTYWENAPWSPGDQQPKLTSLLILLAWANMLPDWNIVILNTSNIQEYIPDMPMEEFRRLYHQAQSDVARCGALYHHGGVYVDTDMIPAQPTALHSFLSHLFPPRRYEMISYGSPDVPTAQRYCRSDAFHWSSNGMGASKRNYLMYAWWTNIKHKLTRDCTPEQFKAYACCYSAGVLSKSCHVPWAALELLRMSHHEPNATLPVPLPVDHHYNLTTRSFCLNGAHSWIIAGYAAPLWYNFSATPVQRTPGSTFTVTTAADGTVLIDACYRDSDDLICPHRNGTNEARIANFYGRAAFHMFNSAQPEHINKIRKLLRSPVGLLKHKVLSGLFAKTLSHELFELLSTPGNNVTLPNLPITIYT